MCSDEREGPPREDANGPVENGQFGGTTESKNKPNGDANQGSEDPVTAGHRRALAAQRAKLDALRGASTPEVDVPRTPRSEASPPSSDYNPGAESIADSLGNSRPNGEWFNCQCPCCDDSDAHLGLKDTDDDRVIVHCFHGCEPAAIYAKLQDLGLYQKSSTQHGQFTGSIVQPIPVNSIPRNFSEFKVRSPQGFQPVKLWWYKRSDGEPLFGIVRFNAKVNLLQPASASLVKPKKTFRPLSLWRLPSNGTLKWYLKAAPKPWPLYNLPALVTNPLATTVITEGEKAATAAAEIFPQHVCVSPAHGAASPANTDWSPIAGRVIIIWPDHDEPGVKFARHVTALCREAGAATISCFNMSQFPPGWDAADILAAHKEGRL
jgi:hypothetical protein